MDSIKHQTEEAFIASIQIETSTESAAKAVLLLTEKEVRKEFLKVLIHGSPEDKAIRAFVFKLAYDKELDYIAEQEWNLLSLEEQGEIQQSLRQAVFAIEGQKSVQTPLSTFVLKVTGLPETPEIWKDHRKLARAKLNLLASGRPLPGLSRVVARAVFPLLKEDEPDFVFHPVCMPFQEYPDNRKGLWEITQGFLEAFDCWVEKRNKAKLGPLTREQLFTAMDKVLEVIGDMSRHIAQKAGSELVSKYGFTPSEVVSSSFYYLKLRANWSCYPFGALALGSFDIQLASHQIDDRICRDWTLGYLSRHIAAPRMLSETEKANPVAALKSQMEEALSLHDEVDRYISFNRILNRFVGYVSADPVDPTAMLEKAVNYYRKEQPQLPSYKKVIAWREKKLQAVGEVLK